MFKVFTISSSLKDVDKEVKSSSGDTSSAAILFQRRVLLVWVWLRTLSNGRNGIPEAELFSVSLIFTSNGYSLHCFVLREELEKVIRAYFIQLTKGCGNKNCENPKCVSGGQMEPLEKNKAAAKAVVLAKENKSDVCGYALTLLNSAPSATKLSSSQDSSTSPQVVPQSTIMAAATSPSGRSGSAEPMEVDTNTSTSDTSISEGLLSENPPTPFHLGSGGEIV